MRPIATNRHLPKVASHANYCQQQLHDVTSHHQPPTAFAPRDTEGFSCSDLMRLCREAAAGPAREAAAAAAAAASSRKQAASAQRRGAGAGAQQRQQRGVRGAAGGLGSGGKGGVGNGRVGRNAVQGKGGEGGDSPCTPPATLAAPGAAAAAAAGGGSSTTPEALRPVEMRDFSRALRLVHPSMAAERVGELRRVAREWGAVA